MSAGSTNPPQPKDAPVRDEAYRRLVAALPCANCKRPGPSQAAHSDSLADGKGMGRKACDLATFPLCADAPGWRGCHSIFDQGGLFTKATRHVKTAQWIAETKAALA